MFIYRKLKVWKSSLSLGCCFWNWYLSSVLCSKCSFLPGLIKNYVNAMQHGFILHGIQLWPCRALRILVNLAWAYLWEYMWICSWLVEFLVGLYELTAAKYQVHEFWFDHLMALMKNLILSMQVIYSRVHKGHCRWQSKVKCADLSKKCRYDNWTVPELDAKASPVNFIGGKSYLEVLLVEETGWLLEKATYIEAALSVDVLSFINASSGSWLYSFKWHRWKWQHVSDDGGYCNHA